MSRYKKIMLQRGVMQKDVLADVRKVEPRVDNPLLSKFVNDVCLPSPRTLESICKSLSCAPLDIYDPREIELAPRSDSDVEKAATTGGGQSTTAGVLAFLYTPDLFLEADFSACFAVLSTSSILSGNRFLVICWSVKLKVMTTLSLYKITSRIKFLTINFLAPLLSISPHTAF